MSFTKYAIILAAVASYVAAQDKAEVIEFNAILTDVVNNLNDYMSIAENQEGFVLPDGVLDVYTQMTTYTDDSYTTLFSILDFSEIDSVMAGLPWYSTRLAPAIASAYSSAGITNSIYNYGAGAAAVSGTTNTQSSTSASASTTSRAIASNGTNSTNPSNVSVDPSAIASLKSAASSAESSATSATSSSSSIASNSSTSSKNGAMKFELGVGAALAGAAALLL
ncbi:hypothetical protein TBLA_0J01790 [Henningerozyma blattae CBS 6284]|uniref:Temperature shock-inducible protein 1 n=1 Tax=Henningerozyma blattae (strain ATCC 34711 / CBS 6284 / DSM 70876 / NBRC 10599 / NRRL Y-10934 / UCD 77-7) TaxID=1071380 RepID=I2H9X1_HENB6|nr:hypothetical protein TBLA_0J01790 [Tetrapisispora blattae CBS 6284]CCH63173.1 hypothetical protein TBLA_0J01790 [Tetrapisispora blattae CBS 6284]